MNLFLAVIAAIGVFEQSLPTRSLPGRGTEIDQLVGKRQPAHYCGGIGYVDLGAAVDGPAYYFR
ncbi:MAG TPA: hypothetical protein VGD23_11025, partial [Sphingomicrobium sp.]